MGTSSSHFPNQVKNIKRENPRACQTVLRCLCLAGCLWVRATEEWLPLVASQEHQSTCLVLQQGLPAVQYKLAQQSLHEDNVGGSTLQG